VVMVVTLLSSSSSDLWRVVSSKDRHMEKSIEQHLHANERGCCCYCFVMRACKDSTSICMMQFVKSRTPLWATRGGGGGMGCFARMGWWHLWQIVSTFSIKLDGLQFLLASSCRMWPSVWRYGLDIKNELLLLILSLDTACSHQIWKVVNVRTISLVEVTTYLSSYCKWLTCTHDKNRQFTRLEVWTSVAWLPIESWLAYQSYV
jgi:hypothetical protein